MITYEYTKVNQPHFLWQELRQSSEVKSHLKNLNIKGDKIWVILEDTFDVSNKPSIDVITVSHDPVNYNEHVAVGKLLHSAFRFGRSLEREFTNESIRLGITQAGLTNHIRKTLHELINCIHTAALYDACYEISIIPASALDATILSSARLLAVRNEIEEYLGLPISTTYDSIAS